LTGGRGGASHSYALASVVLQRKPHMQRKSKVQTLHRRREVVLIAFRDWFLWILTLWHGTFVDTERNLNTTTNKILCRNQASHPCSRELDVQYSFC